MVIRNGKTFLSFSYDYGLIVSAIIKSNEN